MELPIQQVTRVSGVTSRTLRHYDATGLLAPSRTGAGGQRFYDDDALLRLQRILLLRDLGLGLPAIAEVLAGDLDPAAALRTHLAVLQEERERLDRRIRSVRATLARKEGGEEQMADEMFDGFDHRAHEDEVVRRWGQEALDRSNQRWTSLTPGAQQAHRAEHDALVRELGRAVSAGAAPDDTPVQALVARHHAWVSLFWTPDRTAYVGLGQMYVDDPRFTATYDAAIPGTAALLRAAIEVFAERELVD